MNHEYDLLILISYIYIYILKFIIPIYIIYKEKYLKYKLKYLDLKGQIGGVITEDEKNNYLHNTNVIVPILTEFGDLSIFYHLQQNKNLKRLTFTNIRQIIELIERNLYFKDTIYSNLEQKTITHLILSGNSNSQIDNTHLKTLAEILAYYKNVTHINLTNNNFDIAELYKFIRYLRTHDFNNTLHITFSNSDKFTKEDIDALKNEALEKDIEFIFI